MEDNPRDYWVCPNDRQLALRAKLKTGWSVKTNTFDRYTKQQGINDVEQETIVQVIKRAEVIDNMEQERVGRLVEKLENMKKNAMGNGQNQCILCGDEFGLLGASALCCNDCKKAVCTKCGVDTSCTPKEAVWLCKICSETRETWKKSGAWFFKGLPKYILPGRKRIGKYNHGNRYDAQGGCSPSQSTHMYTTWARRGHITDSSGPESEESSDDDPAIRMSRRSKPVRDFDNSSCEGNVNNKRTENETPAGNLSSSPTFNFGINSCQDNIRNPNPLMDQTPFAKLTNVPEDSHQLEKTAGDRIDLSDVEYQNSRSGSVRSTTGSIQSSYSGSHQDLQRRLEEEASRSHSSHSRQGSYRSIKIADNHEGSVDNTIDGTFEKPDKRTKLNGDENFQASGGEQSFQKSITEPTPQPLPRTKLLQEDQPSHLGSLDFSLLYDSINNALHCSIHRAEGLYSMDFSGLADAFVQIHLLPGSNSNCILRTKTVHRTLKPEFDETLSYYGITENDILKRSLRLTVMNEYQYGNEFIGEAIVCLKRLHAHQTKHFSVYLDHKLAIDGQQESINNASSCGKILIGLLYNTQRECLTVKVVCCSNLPAKEPNSFQDTFVKIHLVSEKEKQSFKTSVKIKNQNPEFNEEFHFNVSLENLLKRTLTLTVWEKDKSRHGEFIGGLQLGIKSKGERLWHWLQTIQNPNRRMEKWHQLSVETRE